MYDHDYELSDELRLIKSTIRKFVTNEIIPVEQTLDPDAIELPEEDVIRLRGKTRAMGMPPCELARVFIEYSGYLIDYGIIHPFIRYKKDGMHRCPEFFALCFSIQSAWIYSYRKPIQLELKLFRHNVWVKNRLLGSHIFDKGAFSKAGRKDIVNNHDCHIHQPVF